MKKKRKHTTTLIISYVFLCIGTATMLVPFLWMILTSLKSEAEAFISPPQLFGEKILWSNYLRISDRFNYLNFFMNSLKVCVWVVFFQLFTSAMAGFVFARLRFKGRDKIFMIYLATMMVPGHVTIITNFYYDNEKRHDRYAASSDDTADGFGLRHISAQAIFPGRPCIP
jgi:multiple sugar transport system permease protein